MSFWWLYAALLAVAIGAYVGLRSRRQRAHAAALAVSQAAGLAEPVSLHPVVDPVRCIGSGTCAQACPEQALGVIGGKAVLIDGSACIGHGACAAACPVGAIQLVFGTERRGIDIPQVSPDFESNLPGIYIAGELGGMGLIRKAAEQGRQAVDAIRRRPRGAHDLDLVIVGCGPAGLSAGLAALEHGLRFRLIEQEASLGGAVFHYPRQKVAMTSPVTLALVGQVRFGEVAKERLLDFWHEIVGRTQLVIHFRERFLGATPAGDGFVVRTSQGEYRCRSVLLALGRRGTPRKLDVPGEDSPKVVYRLVDPAQYCGQAVLVVGGGDSAIEAAVAVAEQPGTRVTLSYRGEAFARAKARNRERLASLQRDGRLDLRLGSEVLKVDTATVDLRTPDGSVRLDNDAVIVCAGGELPTPLLKSIGIQFETKYGTA